MVVGLWYVGGGRKMVEVVKREVVLHERCRCCWRQGGRVYCEKIVTVNFRYLLNVTIRTLKVYFKHSLALLSSEANHE